MLDFELAKKNGQPLTALDEARLRNTQARKARKMFVNTMSVSDREPLMKYGYRGDQDKNWRYAIKWKHRLVMFQKNVGVATMNRLTGGTGDWTKQDGAFRPRRGHIIYTIFEKNGIRDMFLSLCRSTLIKFPIVAVGIVGSFIGLYHYHVSWSHWHSIHTFKPNTITGDTPSECLPDDNKLVARMNDLVAIRMERGMNLLEGGKTYPLGTRYDWVEGKPVLPGDKNYYWVDGRPLRKDRGYFNPGPAEVMGKIAYEEDDFFGPDGKPRPEAMPYRQSGHH